MDDTRLEALLAENLKAAKENAEELRKIRKNLLYMGILRTVVWLALAGVPVFLYLHFVKPTVEDIFGPYSSMFQ